MWEIAADFSAEMDFRQNIHKDKWMQGLFYIFNTFFVFPLPVKYFTWILFLQILFQAD